MKTVTKSMTGVVAGMGHAMKSMDVEKVRWGEERRTAGAKRQQH
jgi:hypothetical protein